MSTVDACNSWYSGAFLLETVPSVLYILERHGNDPEEAIVRAVNDTRDNDTVAAIVGAAVGALHGAIRLPERWRMGSWGVLVRTTTGGCRRSSPGLRRSGGPDEGRPREWPAPTQDRAVVKTKRSARRFPGTVPTAPAGASRWAGRRAVEVGARVRALRILRSTSLDLGLASHASRPLPGVDSAGLSATKGPYIDRRGASGEPSPNPEECVPHLMSHCIVQVDCKRLRCTEEGIHNGRVVLDVDSGSGRCRKVFVDDAAPVPE